MIKHFCDVCGDQVQRNSVSQRLTRARKTVTVEVLVATDGVWNGGAICYDCLLDVVLKGKDTKAPR